MVRPKTPFPEKGNANQKQAKVVDYESHRVKLHDQVERQPQFDAYEWKQLRQRCSEPVVLDGQVAVFCDFKEVEGEVDKYSSFFVEE